MLVAVLLRLGEANSVNDGSMVWKWVRNFVKYMEIHKESFAWLSTYSTRRIKLRPLELSKLQKFRHLRRNKTRIIWHLRVREISLFFFPVPNCNEIIYYCILENIYVNFLIYNPKSYHFVNSLSSTNESNRR